MALAYVGVGSNIRPEENIIRALVLLKKFVLVGAVSTFFRTEPAGDLMQPYYINGVAAIESSLPPAGIQWGVFRKIEEDLGRVRSGDKNAPRPIDLDLILYDNDIIRLEGLTIPAPDIYTRPFLAIPLLELDPLLVLPDTGFPVSRIIQDMDTGTLLPLREFSEKLKKELGHEP